MICKHKSTKSNASLYTNASLSIQLIISLAQFSVAVEYTDCLSEEGRIPQQMSFI